MGREPTDVLIEAYLDTRPAKLDYEAVTMSGAKLEGAICDGGAGLIVAYPRSSAEDVDRVVTRSVKKAIDEADGKKLATLKGALAEAEEKLKQAAS